MITTIGQNTKLKPKMFSCTEYGELTIYGDNFAEFTAKDRKEIKSWCKNVNSSLIYIWIDKKHLNYNTSKMIMQLFFDLDRYQKSSRIVVQWRIDKSNQEILKTAKSFKNLFPQVSFIIQND